MPRFASVEPQRKRGSDVLQRMKRLLSANQSKFNRLQRENESLQLEHDLLQAYCECCDWLRQLTCGNAARDTAELELLQQLGLQAGQACCWNESGAPSWTNSGRTSVANATSAKNPGSCSATSSDGSGNGSTSGKGTTTDSGGSLEQTTVQPAALQTTSCCCFGGCSLDRP